MGCRFDRQEKNAARPSNPTTSPGGPAHARRCDGRISCNETPIDETDPTVLDWLKTLQGNILRHHGRLHAVHVLFAFDDGASVAVRKALLARLARDYVTSAADQLAGAAPVQAGRSIPAGLFGHLVLSAYGYKALGLDPNTLFPELPEPVAESSFAAGMRATACHDFRDRPREWEEPYRQQIDGMLVLAHTDPEQLEPEVAAALTLLGTTCRIRAIESGHVVKNATGKGIEPFGFLDGRSQPLFLDRDFDSIGGSPKETRVAWDPFAPLGLVLGPRSGHAGRSPLPRQLSGLPQAGTERPRFPRRRRRAERGAGAGGRWREADRCHGDGPLPRRDGPALVANTGRTPRSGQRLPLPDRPPRHALPAPGAHAQGEPAGNRARRLGRERQAASHRPSRHDLRHGRAARRPPGRSTVKRRGHALPLLPGQRAASVCVHAETLVQQRLVSARRRRVPTPSSARDCVRCTVGAPSTAAGR